MTLYFITGNKSKFKEAKALIPKIKQIELDLPEIQEIDSKKIIEEKLKQAIKIHKGKFFCEDTSLYLDCLNGFPGPLIKWLLISIKNKGIYKLVSNYKNKKALAETLIGYSDGKKIKFFEGNIKGEITSEKGKKGFGWDRIFIPTGHNKTMAQMSTNEKNKISMRKKALMKFNNYLNSSGK